MLTANNFRKRKFRIFIIISLLVLLLIISVIVPCLFIKRENTKFFKNRLFYILYIDKSEKQSKLQPQQDLIKKLGGAGEIYYYDKFFYLTASVYLNNVDANQVLNNVFSNYTNAGILKLERKDLKPKVVSKISNNIQAINYFKLMDKIITDLTENQFRFMSGLITQRDLITNILTLKLELENILENFEFNKDDFIMKNIYNSQSSCVLYFNNFMNKFFESTKKESLLCELSNNIVLTNFELFKTLNN